MFVQTQTFDFKDVRDELEFISAVMDALGHNDRVAAMKILTRRHDQLTAQPKLKLYDPREIMQ